MIDASADAALDNGESEVAILLAREERFTLALKAGRFYTWDWDLRRNKIVWAGGLEKELRLSDAPGDIELFRKLVHPDDVEFVTKRIEAAIRGPA